jgi:hypothetical protein
MKDIVVIDSKTRLIKADVNLLEQKLGVNLPSEYKNFLLLHNGGHPEKDIYNCLNITFSSDLDRFYAFYEGENSNLLKEIYMYGDRLPKGFLPIAHDSGSNKVCICVDGPAYGKVYFWDFKKAVPYGEEPILDNMYLIANNFTDFINGLYGADLKYDASDRKIWTYTHDKYTLPYSEQVKKYGAVITDFFAGAPASVEDYVIEETESTKTLLLRYDVKSQKKRYIRKIDMDGKILEEWTETIK